MSKYLSVNHLLIAKNTVILGYAVQKSDFWGSIWGPSGGVLFPNYVKTLVCYKRLARNVQWGVLRKLETTSNNLDPDFDRSSIRLSRILCRNIGDLHKKKVFSQAKIQFFKSKSHQVLDQFPSPIPGGELFSFLVQKSASKVLNTGYFAYSSGQ